MDRRRQSHKSSTSRSTSPTRSAPYRIDHPVPTPSRWQQLVLGASSAAGTTAAIISEESMKCLKYCLSWLQYAIQYIEQQMIQLQKHLGDKHSNTLTVQNNQSFKLSSVKKNIIEILRKVVDVVSKYAGSSLPIQARQTVRNFILNLPGKWTSINDIKSTGTSPCHSPLLGNRSISSISSSSSSSIDRHEETAYRLLNFGQESVDMLSSVSTVFSDTIDRAEIWIDRIKIVPGLSTRDKNDDDNDDRFIQLPPIRTLNINSTPDKPH